MRRKLACPLLPCSVLFASLSTEFEQDVLHLWHKRKNEMKKRERAKVEEAVENKFYTRSFNTVLVVLKSRLFCSSWYVHALFTTKVPRFSNTFTNQ